MKIRDVIEQLSRVADALPNGQDSELLVALCDGEGLDASFVLEIDTMAQISKDTGRPTRMVGIIKGHPHRDDDPMAGRMRGVADRADEHLQKWAQDPDLRDGGAT